MNSILKIALTCLMIHKLSFGSQAEATEIKLIETIANNVIAECIKPLAAYVDRESTKDADALGKNQIRARYIANLAYNCSSYRSKKMQKNLVGKQAYHESGTLLTLERSQKIVTQSRNDFDEDDGCAVLNEWLKKEFANICKSL